MLSQPNQIRTLTAIGLALVLLSANVDKKDLEKPFAVVFGTLALASIWFGSLALVTKPTLYTEPFIGFRLFTGLGIATGGVGVLAALAKVKE